MDMVWVVSWVIGFILDNIFGIFGPLVNNQGGSTWSKYIKGIPVDLLIGIGFWLDVG